MVYASPETPGANGLRLQYLKINVQESMAKLTAAEQPRATGLPSEGSIGCLWCQVRMGSDRIANDVISWGPWVAAASARKLKRRVWCGCRAVIFIMLYRVTPVVT